MIDSRVVGSFRPFPKKMAWAITIHKSHGKTFDNLILDIGRGAFCHGQIYVALSRCTSFEGIVLKSKISAATSVQGRSGNRSRPEIVWLSLK